MYKLYIKQNITIFSVFLFIAIFGIIQYIKPSCFYNNDGSIREFGIGYKSKTIFPIWVLSILLSILCYLVVFYYIHL